MKKHLLKGLTLWLCLSASLSLFACNNTPSHTEAPSETESVVETEAPTETESVSETESMTETDTETESSAPESHLLTSVRFSALESLDHTKYLLGAKSCSFSFTDDAEEGRVLALTAVSGAEPKYADPHIHFNIKALANDLNLEYAKTAEFPHVVLKVKNCTDISRKFGLWGCLRKNPDSVQGKEHVTYISADGAWQYIYFDMSDLEQNMTMYRMDMSNFAVSEGETVLISEIRQFATAEEALTLTQIAPDVYPVEHSDTLKVMSFNIKTEQDKDNKWPLEYRMEMFRALMDRRQPDVIGLQEDTPGWFTVISSVFNDSYARVGEVGDSSPEKSAESCSIYYRVDKFELLNHGTFWLSDTPDVVGSKVENANESRICTWVHLKDHNTGKEFVHFNTHLDHNGNNESTEARKIRLAQLNNLLQFAYALGDIPMIITGDFNETACNSSDEPRAFYQIITGTTDLTLDDGTTVNFPFSNVRLDAAEVVVPNGTDIATMVNRHTPSSSKYDPTYLPIDYVFCSTGDWESMVYETELYTWCDLYMSDHLPLYAELVLK